MSDLEKRFHRVMIHMSGNESLAASLDGDAAGELLSWGQSAAKRIVEETEGLDEEAAEEKMSPRLKAIRLLMRAAGRWVGEAKTLDQAARLALWNRIAEQARVLFGETFVLPSMNDALAQLPADANSRQMVAWLKTYLEEKGTKE